ncbi:hypothetical protein PPL_03281 [Heterostelium album PN500]|uniref:Uncharacterized protein n=1 Tax=Heterostelium pallidum (strain ATCC 26659 / Pp 5 / PN500) TaxID=670386 RepID=D3B4F7_HETP5|nr:hypothetical protein PPL_03281 [Heterostelium album PN500]EFA84205.1 hypothetical protein PPL_03281 [Heterostelium album PN500]|eukprot:XP_020436321.1 hypothetical protein PPL_03281 [Heterostelium album PN500]
MTLFSVIQIGKQRINITSDRFGGDVKRVSVMCESGSRVRYCTNITITEPNVSLQCSTGPYQVSGFGKFEKSLSSSSTTTSPSSPLSSSTSSLSPTSTSTSASPTHPYKGKKYKFNQ